jgi:hypothetical protein
VIWDLSLEFLFLLLDWLVNLSADALSEDFSESECLHNVNKDVMAFFNETKLESRETNLSDGTIVEDLASNVLQVNAVSYVGLEKKISSFVESFMKGMMISVLQGSSYLHL